jgi:hypothetical protein
MLLYAIGSWNRDTDDYKKCAITIGPGWNQVFASEQRKIGQSVIRGGAGVVL